VTIDPLAEALRYAADPPGNVPMTKLATVTGVTAGGVQLRFDGESLTSSRTYRTAGGCRVGDRVLCTRIGSAWVVVGAVGAAAEVPLSRVSGAISPQINPNPADGVLRTTHIANGVGTVPAGATTAVVSMSLTAGSSINAAAVWTPLFSTNNGASSWENLLTNAVSHNNTSPNVGTGFSVVVEFDVRSVAVGQAVAVAVNGYGGSGGGGIYHGNLLYSITFRGVKP
jgi:hypothetical protein